MGKQDLNEKKLWCAECCDLSHKMTWFCLLLKYCKRANRWKWVIEVKRLWKGRLKEEKWGGGKWNRGDICAFRLRLKGWYSDGKIRERGHWKQLGWWKSEKRLKMIPHWLSGEEEESCSCRSIDEEIAFECGLRKYWYLFLLMPCQRQPPELDIMTLEACEIPSNLQELAA